MTDPLLDKLINGSRQGARKDQKALYERFAPKMYGLVLRYASSEADAQDILQNGFIKMFRKLDHFRGEGSFEGWLRRIMVTTAIEHYRRQKAMQPLQKLDDSEGGLQERLSSGETVLDKIQAEELMNLIGQLSPGYRAVLNMYVVEGYSHKEIAEMLGISEGTSKSQLARARTILKQLIVEKEEVDYAARTK